MNLPAAARTILVLLIFLVFAGDVSAQINNDGSIYSRFGVGERIVFGSSQGQSFGGLGTGLFTPNYLNTTNPATWSDQVYTRFSGGLDFHNIRSSDVSNTTSTLSNGSIGAISFGFPIKERKIGVGVVFEPYSRVGYKAEVFGSLPEEGSEPATDYNVIFEGEGGIQEIKVGLGYQVKPGISVGATANFFFGVIEYGQSTTFTEQGEYLSLSRRNTNTRVYGGSLGLGAAYRKAGVFKDDDVLTLGYTLNLPANLTANQNKVLEQNLERDSLSVVDSGSLTLPLRTSFGVSYLASRSLLLVADWLYEPWSSFDSDIALGGFIPNETTQLSDRNRLSTGIQYTPAGAEFDPNYFSRISYRLGVYRERTHFQPDVSNKIATYAVVAGFGLPSLFGGTSVDFNGEFGKRGLQEGILVRDLFFRFTMTLNFGERWFVKRKIG